MPKQETFTYGRMVEAPYASDDDALRTERAEREYRLATPYMGLLAEAINHTPIEARQTKANRRMVARQEHAAYWRKVEGVVKATPIACELPDWILRPSRIGYGFACANQNSAHIMGSRLDDEGKRYLGNSPPRRLPPVKTPEQARAEFAELVGFDL